MRTSPRWLVPLAVAATIAGGVAVGSAQADSVPSLPDRTPEQVLAAVAGSRVTAMSGTVVTRTDLGLPAVSLPGGEGHGGGMDVTDVQGLVTRFLSGKNTLRIWVDGPARQRVQLLDPFDELDVVRNGDRVWTYSARRNEVGTATVPADADHSAPRAAAPPGPAEVTPGEVARRAIAAADPTTEVSLGAAQVVAGRSAYSLTLTPKTDRTLVDRVVVAVDAGTGVPLQAEIYARGHRTPAVETGFTSVSFDRPGAGTFTFTPPKGAKVNQLGSGGTAKAAKPSADGPRASADGPPPEVTGTGWATVVEMPAPSGGSPALSGGSATPPGSGDRALLDQLTTPVAGGGRALTSRLLSVLITADGRVLAGAVPVSVLVDAARR